MFFAYWMVLAAALLPYVTTAIAKSGGASADNRAPRLAAERLTGSRQRADWAHRNHFETFPAFAAGVIIASLANVPHDTINALAGAFVALRILYTFAYMSDRATLR